MILELRRIHLKVVEALVASQMASTISENIEFVIAFSNAVIYTNKHARYKKVDKNCDSGWDKK